MRRAAFTLVELILVLAILAVMVAVVAPALARSSRAQSLEHEALRLLAVTEHARDEAVSTGVFMAVYVDADGGKYGMEPASATSGVEKRKDFTLPEELQFEAVDTTSHKGGKVIVFSPAGFPEVSSIDTVVLTNKAGERRAIVRQTDGYGYELAKEEEK